MHALESIGYTENDIVNWSLSLRHTRITYLNANDRTVIYRISCGSAAENNEKKCIKQLLQDQVERVKMLITHNCEFSHRLAAVEGAQALRLPSLVLSASRL